MSRAGFLLIPTPSVSSGLDLHLFFESALKRRKVPKTT